MSPCESFGTFGEAPLGPQKKGAGNFLPEIFVLSATNTDSDLQLARTPMSPVRHSEHSRKQRQRTGPQRKGAGNFLPEIFVFSAINTDSDLQLARTEMSPARHSEHSRKHR